MKSDTDTTIRRATRPLGPEFVTVYDTPSGMGGAFEVSIERENDDGSVAVRVWYGRADWPCWHSWGDFDGYRFTTTRDKLTNEQRKRLRKS